MIAFYMMSTTTVKATNSVISYTTSNGSVAIPQGDFFDASGNPLTVSSSSSAKLQFDGEIVNIGNYAFHNCKGLTSISLPNSVTSIGYFAFSNCDALTTPVYNSTIFARLPISWSDSYEIPEGIQEIASAAFRNCSDLASVSIPQTVTTISESAFYNCNSLTSVTIPNSVTTIGDCAFRYCELSSIIAESTTPATIQERTFKDVDKTSCVLYVPYGSLTAYQNAPYWKEFEIIEELDSDISTLDNAIYMNQTEGRIGGTRNISVRLKNNYAVKGFQFVMELPDDVVINNWAPSENRLPSGVTISDKNVSGFIDGNKISIACSLDDDEIFTGIDDEIATINVTFEEVLEDGNYPTYLTNCKVTNSSNATKNLTNVKSSLELEAYELGDANGDGKVRIGDATAILNYIVNNESEGFNKKAADANEDGIIRIGDVTLVLNAIVNQ